MQHRRPVRRALISVSDKTGIVDFARALIAHGIELLSTGGTAHLLSEAGLPVTEVSDYTRFPEMMDGRVKTLHPNVHGGILGRRGQDDATMEAYGIQPIDMVVVNLYPFAQTVAQSDCSLTDAVENIDIGGPAMIRSAAKNYQDVVVVVKDHDYDTIVEELTANEGALTLERRFDLAVKAFEYTAAYDCTIANYFGRLAPDFRSGSREPAGRFPRTLNLNFIKKQDMRYGENSHQEAAFYIEEPLKEVSIAAALQLQGKALSYNNIADADTALECVKNFAQPACVIVKHANPCGVAIASSLLAAYELAYKTDSTSAFGGIIAFNRELDAKTAQAIVSRQFVEVIIAPCVSLEALKITAAKPNIRILSCGEWKSPQASLDFKRVNGGLLVQSRDLGTLSQNVPEVVTQRQPDEEEMRDALFGWTVAKFVKSNAIVYARNGMTVGIGAGQMSRVYAAKIAGIKATDEGLEIAGSTMASDAFLPFRDGIDAAAAVGVTCVIQPGGSIRDAEVIAAANEHNIAMIFTGMRHFRH